MSGQVCVRPAWGPDAPPLSARALVLLLREWRELGLVDEDPDPPGSDPVAMLRGVQQRAATVSALAPARRRRPQLELVTSAGSTAPPAAREDPWPTFTGRLLTYGETAWIGRDKDGQLI